MSFVTAPRRFFWSPNGSAIYAVLTTRSDADLVVAGLQSEGCGELVPVDRLRQLAFEFGNTECGERLAQLLDMLQRGTAPEGYDES